MGQLKNIVFFLLYLLFNPRLIKPLVNRIYLPVYIQFEWIKNYNISTIVDAGANCGHVAKTLNYLFPQAVIYAFEPIKEECDKIKAKVPSDNLVVENIALSNKKGVATLHRYNYSPASSLLPALPGYAKNFKDVSKLTVETTTLDSYFHNKNLASPIFLKIDTQGTEKLILEGGEHFLKDVSIIHAETLFEGLYKNQGYFKDIYMYLTKRGFQYMGDVNESNFYPSFGPTQAANSIFVRSK